MLKKIFKIFFFFILSIIAFLAIVFFIYNKKLPTGIEGQKAELLTQKLLDFIQYENWERTNIVSFTFRDSHHHIWDKKRHYAQTSWENYKAIFDVNSKEGKVWKDNQLISDQKLSKELINKAWGYFLNDSFWLNPIAKLHDPGVKRTSLDMEEGKKGLLASYQSGGITPGDAYLWILDEKDQPIAWRMWVDIIPIGGLETSWEDWNITKTGAKIAYTHRLEIGGLNISISNVKTGFDWTSFGSPDPFYDL